MKVKERTRQLELSNERLAASNSELEQFAYVASHDLQEPLRMVICYLQFLENRTKDKLDTEDKECIGFAVGGALRMRALVQDLLAFARIGKGEEPIATVDFNDVLGEALGNLKTMIDENEARVTVNPLPTLNADSLQIVQLFQNLISNAIKYRSEKPPEIQINAEQRDNEWVFSVRDNGMGISPEYNEKIFVVFQRLHSDREKYPGTGIGLSICKKIVGRHGGRIWVESSLNEGATFYFSFPKPADEINSLSKSSLRADKASGQEPAVS